MIYSEMNTSTEKDDETNDVLHKSLALVWEL